MELQLDPIHHRHFRFIEKMAINLDRGSVFMSNGSALTMLDQLFSYYDNQNAIVWITLLAENTSTKERTLITKRAVESFLVDTWITCKECH